MVKIKPKSDGVSDVLNYESFKNYLKAFDIASYCGLAAVSKMHQNEIKRYVDDIFKFLNHRKILNAFESYVARATQLRILQAKFEAEGRYTAANPHEVQPVGDEQYKLALLLSFISTSHRFDILKTLVNFLQLPSTSPREVLSIGYGTGYELKLVFDEIPSWSAVAYDTSPESYRYATDLLKLFKHSNDCLRHECFAFESARFMATQQGRYGKIILCELLEHLQDPELALRSLRCALHAEGRLFCTMAVNIAQEDHVYLYRSADQARQQMLKCGFEIIEERLAPVVILPFKESNRSELFKKGNYICVAKPR